MSANELQIPESLRAKGITTIERRGNALIVSYFENAIPFDIENSIMKTVQNFERMAKGVIRDRLLMQHIISHIARLCLELKRPVGTNATNSQKEEGAEEQHLPGSSAARKIVPVPSGILQPKLDIIGKPVSVCAGMPVMLLSLAWLSALQTFTS